MTVQNPNQDGGSVVIEPFDQDFRAVTAAVNQDLGLVLFGGIVDSQSAIYIYSIVDQESVTPVEAMDVDGRITSIASSGDFISYVTMQGALEVVPVSAGMMRPGPTGSPMAPDSMSSTATPIRDSVITGWAMLLGVLFFAIQL